MRSMAHCRFESTLDALISCYTHLHEKRSAEEEKAKLRLVILCKQIVAAEGGGHA